MWAGGGGIQNCLGIRRWLTFPSSTWEAIHSLTVDEMDESEDRYFTASASLCRLSDWGEKDSWLPNHKHQIVFCTDLKLCNDLYHLLSTHAGLRGDEFYKYFPLQVCSRSQTVLESENELGLHA